MIHTIRCSLSVHFTVQYTIGPQPIIGFAVGPVGFSFRLNPMRCHVFKDLNRRREQCSTVIVSTKLRGVTALNVVIFYTRVKNNGLGKNEGVCLQGRHFSIADRNVL